MSPSRNSKGRLEISLGNSANSSFDMDDSFESTSTEESVKLPVPPATKMDFGPPEIRKKNW